jgi:hypothetical protein
MVFGVVVALTIIAVGVLDFFQFRLYCTRYVRIYE